MKHTKCLRMIRNIPPVRWENAVRKMDSVERTQMVLALDDIIQSASRLRGYIDRQSLLPDKGMQHSQAVDQSNRLVKRVRKVLGYTIPDNPIRF